MAENQSRRERLDVGKWLTAAGLATLLAEGFAKQAEWADEREKGRKEEAARRLAMADLGSLGVGGVLGMSGLLGVATAQVLMGAVKYGDQLQTYGKREFKRGTIGQFKKLASGVF